MTRSTASVPWAGKSPVSPDAYQAYLRAGSAPQTPVEQRGTLSEKQRRRLDELARTIMLLANSDGRYRNHQWLGCCVTGTLRKTWRAYWLASEEEPDSDHKYLVWCYAIGEHETHVVVPIDAMNTTAQNFGAACDALAYLIGCEGRAVSVWVQTGDTPTYQP